MNDLIMESLLEENHNLDLALFKNHSIAEAAFRQFEIDCKEAEIRVMTESGEIEDLIYLREEAEKDLKDRIKAIIDRILKAIAEFFNKIKTKIISTLTSKETKDNLKAVEGKIKLFPFLKGKKVTVDNIDKQEKATNSALAKIKKVVAKCKAGVNVTMDDINDIKDAFEEEHGKATGVSAAQVVTIGALINQMSSMTESLSDYVNNSEKEAKELIAKCRLENSQVPDSVLEAAARFISAAAKTKVTDRISFLRSSNSVMKTAIIGVTKDAKKAAKDEKNTNESVEETEEIGKYESSLEEFVNSINFVEEEAGDPPVKQPEIKDNPAPKTDNNDTDKEIEKAVKDLDKMTNESTGASFESLSSLIASL